MTFKFKSPDVYLRNRVEARLQDNRSGLFVVLEDRGDGVGEDDQVYPDGSKVDDNWVINPVHLREGKFIAALPDVDVSKIKVRRSPTGIVVLDAPNYGMVGFGDKRETNLGDAWQYDRMGALNPLYIQALVAQLQHYVKPECEKEWIGINPDYDTGIDFSSVVPHYTSEHTKTVHHMKYDAPDIGVHGPFMEVPVPRGGPGKKVFKFDEKGELNPRFLQMRRAVVRWG